jgi:hypothetical protein
MHPNRHSAKHERNHTHPKNAQKKRVVADSPVTSPLETCGEVFSDGKCIELVRDSETGRLELLAFDGEKHTRGACVEIGGQMYVPQDLDPSIVRAVKLPTDCVEYGTTDKLFTAIEESLIDNGIPEDVALPLTFFVFAACFTDGLPAAPCLAITGSRPETSLVFRLLGCLVRHPMPLIGLSMASFRSVPMCLQPTFLIDQEVQPSMARLLIAANNRDAWLPSKGGVVNVYSAKAIYGGMTATDVLLGDGVLHINLLPSRGKLPVLDVRAEKAIEDQFQPMLLMYRARNLAKVRNSEFDLPGFASGIRILARILGAPLVDAPALQAGLRPVLQGQQEKIRARGWLDERGAVIEAALALCHRGLDDRLYVGAIAATATEILKGRGENVLLEPKAVGAMLRSAFGIFPKRDAQGFAVRLTEDIRRKIHGLGQSFEVASFEAREERCSHCTEVFAADGLGGSEKDV